MILGSQDFAIPATLPPRTASCTPLQENCAMRRQLGPAANKCGCARRCPSRRTPPANDQLREAPAYLPQRLSCPNNLTNQFGADLLITTSGPNTSGHRNRVKIDAKRVASGCCWTPLHGVTATQQKHTTLNESDYQASCTTKPET